MFSSIQSIPLFSKLNSHQLNQIESLLQVKHYEKGEAIFLQNDSAQRLFILKQGKVKIAKFNSEGRELIIKFFGSGDLFGEAPLFIENGVYPVAAYAFENSEVYYLTKKDLMTFIIQNPDASLTFMEILSQKLLLLLDQVEALSLKNVRTRVILFLLESIPQDQKEKEYISFPMPFSQSDIASSLGTVREHISRILSKLSQEGLLEITHKQITIPNLTKLKESLFS